MSWVKASDTSATYPRLMNVASLASSDDRTLNEVAGFVFRLTCLSGAHFTDYVLPWAQVQMVGGSRVEALVDAAEKTGLLTVTVTPEGFRAVQIVNDPDFLNLITSEQRYSTRVKNKDLRDPWLKAQVIFRDGDNCRWCSVPVAWEGRGSDRSGELDHLEPGKPGSPETIVVACRKCNAARQDRVEEWAATHDLLTIPLQPRYSPASTKLFIRCVGDDWESRMSEVATSGSNPSSASEGRRDDDPGKPRKLASEGPSRLTPAEEGPCATGASEGPLGPIPGESNSSPVVDPKVSDPGVSSALDSPGVSETRSSSADENASFTAVSKPVLPGRDGEGFGRGFGSGRSGTVRDGPGGAEESFYGSRQKRRRR